MNDLFRDLLDQGVVVYLDDILVYSTSPSDHKRLLEEVFKRLRQHKIYLAPDKCEFAVAETEFLGHIVTGEGINGPT